MEVRTTRSDKTDTRRQASQENDDSQDNLTEFTEQVVSTYGQHRSTCIKQTKAFNTSSTNVSDKYINNTKKSYCNSAYFHYCFCNNRTRCSAAKTNKVDYKNSKYYGSQCIHRIIAVQETLQHSCRCITISRLWHCIAA